MPLRHHKELGELETGMNLSTLSYPDARHRRVLTLMADYFKKYPGAYAVILTGSMARGKAVEGSCIDLCIFLEKQPFCSLASTVFIRKRAYSKMGGDICFYHGDIEGGVTIDDVRADLEFTDGVFKPHSDNSFDITRDEFETTIGNLFVYARTLWEKGSRYQRLGRKYLPFYSDRLREERLKGTWTEFCYKIWKTRWLAERGEFLASLYALLEAQRIFLQHLFIQKRKYPIDYTKWIREQCTEILRMPSLYEELMSVFKGTELTHEGLTERAGRLEELFNGYASPDRKANARQTVSREVLNKNSRQFL